VSWGIIREEFERNGSPPRLTEDDRLDGFMGAILSYGFGDDGQGNSNAVLSGKKAWEYACKRMRVKTWQCQYIDFDKKDHIRLRLGAPPRPKGLYYSKFQLNF
jgi:hypothetical protein